MKTIKEHLHEKHGKHFQDCNFGIKEFNLHKRTLSPEELLTANKPTKGGDNKKEEDISIDGTSEGGLPTKGKGKPTPTPSSTPVPTPTPTPKPTHTSGGVIFLDFTGYLVTGTSWNYAGDINCSPANLTALQVDEVVANVTGEYAPYNVLVTTDEAVYNAADPFKRMRCIFTETWEWYGQAGGVAFLGSFTWGDNTPCFVFTSLLNYNIKYIKEAGSHEVGHTFGLYHQSSYDANCVKTSEYNYGNGVEAPIMGVGYYVPDGGTRWWIGPNPYGCNSIQDDNAILTTVIGLK